MGKHGPTQAGGRNIFRSKDGPRDSHFMQGLKAVGKFAKDSGIASKVVDAAAGAAKSAVPSLAPIVDGARSAARSQLGVGYGGAFGHRKAATGRGSRWGGARKVSKSGKEYPSSVGSNAQVWHGSKQKTPGGLTKDDLMKTSKGRIVSKKKHAQGLKQFNKPGVKEAFEARMFKKASAKAST
jgi:hypothetical protein